MIHEVRLPDIQILITAADWDVAVVSFYRLPDNVAGFEVVTGIDGHCSIDMVVSALQEAVKALNASDWRSLDELGASAVQGSGEPPF